MMDVATASEMAAGQAVWRRDRGAACPGRAECLPFPVPPAVRSFAEALYTVVTSVFLTVSRAPAIKAVHLRQSDEALASIAVRGVRCFAADDLELAENRQ
jgi:hypothetical protein